MAENVENKVGRFEHLRTAGLYGGMVVLVAALFAELSLAVPGMSHPLSTGPLLTASDVTFYLLASLAMVSGALVAFSKSIIYSAVALLGALLGAGGLYIFLRADFVAITQLLIYVGGVLVLILFAVMLTSRIAQNVTNPSVGRGPGLVLLGLIGVVLCYVASQTPWPTAASPLALEATAERIGDLFLGHYLIAFEVISLLLLATLIGAVVVARKEIKE